MNDEDIDLREVEHQDAAEWEGADYWDCPMTGMFADMRQSQQRLAMLHERWARVRAERQEEDEV